MGVPCSHTQDTTPKEDGPWNAEMRSAQSPEQLHGSWTMGTCEVSGARRRQEHSVVRPTHGSGAHGCTATRLGKGRGQDASQEPVPKTRGPACCPGEALLWQASEYPGGTNMTNGKRGSLVGNNPEALRWKAPKGQPMIRGENLLDVCVEAPQGQPRNHRRHPIQVV